MALGRAIDFNLVVVLMAVTYFFMTQQLYVCRSISCFPATHHHSGSEHFVLVGITRRTNLMSNPPIKSLQVI